MIEKIQIMVKDFEESCNEMPFESVGRAFMALMAFAKGEDTSEILGDDVVAKVQFQNFKAHVLRMEEYRQKDSRNGSKGGAPIGNSNARKTTQNNPKQPKTTQNKAKQSPNLTLPNLTNNIKRQYGECSNVLLTDEEYQKVKDQGLTNLIDELSFYIAGSGKQYKSHYAVIRQWANRREKEKNAVIIKPNQFTQGVQQRDIDFDELEKKLVKNL